MSVGSGTSVVTELAEAELGVVVAAIPMAIAHVAATDVVAVNTVNRFTRRSVLSRCRAENCRFI